MPTVKDCSIALFFAVLSEYAVCETQITRPATMLNQNCPPRSPISDGQANVSVDGIDISRYQGKFVSFANAEISKVQFVFIKATESTHLVDRYFVAHVTQAKAACIPFGVYHFYDPRAPYEDQLRHFLNTVPAGYIDLPPVVDIEKAPVNSRTDWKSELAAFLKGIENHYKTVPLIYTGRAFAQQHFADSDFNFARYPLWLAEYPSKRPVRPTTREQRPQPIKPWPRWHFWQYTEDCRVDGVVGFVDCNRFFGRRGQLETLRLGESSR
jgi:lysozyme